MGPGIPPVAYAVIVGVIILLRWASVRGRANRIAQNRARAVEAARAAAAAQRAPGASRLVPQYRAPAAPPGRPLGRLPAENAPPPHDAVPRPAPPADEVTFAQLVERAAWLVVDRQDASMAMVRRELGIDVRTAVRVLYELQRRGIVGPPHSDLTPREVLVPRGQ